jgi:uncharacterized membrane protein YhiD involved in acid resistance
VSRRSAPGPRARTIAAVTVLVAIVVGTPAALARPAATSAMENALQGVQERGLEQAESLAKELGAATVRLPLAAALGALLAWRPRRRGMPKRRSAVVETQIVLAVVGALIMLVVGASLARAFGIVGVASLIRYRSKINDPKDAVVMLSALAVGLAAGSGLFALAVFSTLFLFVLLWFIEGFERPTRVFELSVKLGEESTRLRPAVEQMLRRFDIDYELRGASEEGSAYLVTVPNDFTTNRLSRDLSALSRDGKGAVEWVEKQKSQAQ